MSLLSSHIAPKFVDNDELMDREVCKRLFGSMESTSEAQASASHKELRRFKQLNFYAFRMKELVERYGDEAVNRPGYQWYSELHRKLRNEITSDHLGLVYRACKRHRVASVHDDDLLSEGMVALDRAISSFDPWRGLCFSTYACTAIARGLSRYRMKEAKRVRWMSEHINRESDRSGWMEIRRSEASELYAERLTRLVTEGRVELTKVEQDVLEQRFPAEPYVKPQTFAAIARTINLSKERVRQIHQTALGKLREALEADAVLM